MQSKISDNLIIRTVEEQDLEQILLIENQVALAPWSKEAFIDCKKIYNFVVAVLVKPSLNIQLVVGYGIIIIHNIINESHILNLAVSPEWQRKKIGSKIINYLITLSKGKIFLEVHKNNISAINLYKQFNFVEVGCRKNYYNTKNGRKDALIYVRDL